MRIVQIIDSLEIGGAERMAVNYANALSKKIEFSALVATRGEGQLLDQINENVFYLFLNKRKSFDWSAVVRLKNFVKKNKIEIIHAHSTSFFITVLVKFLRPSIKIVWHDHFGSRVAQSNKENRILIFCSLFFSSIFTVNRQLKDWSAKWMFCKNVIFIPNFTLENHSAIQSTNLKGENGKRIVFLANLKTPKNHLSILEAFCKLKLSVSDWSLHLIGKDYSDLYSQDLKDFIHKNNLDNHVHLYGTKNDIEFILSQASIGVLASTFEGFPVTLIEYGKAKLAVLSTNVGFCSEMIKNEESGLLFDPLNEQELLSALEKLTKDESLRMYLGSNFQREIENTYGEETIIKKVLLEYNKIA